MCCALRTYADYSTYCQTEMLEHIIAKDLLAADLKCSLFVSALKSYKHDSVLRPFPPFYTSDQYKDFDALIVDVNTLPGLQEIIQNKADKDMKMQELLSWILSDKLFTIKSLKKDKYEEIRILAGSSNLALPTPDFLFEIEYCEKLNTKFQETRGERDLLYALHGSRLENFHSILHNGLHCHLNKTSLFGEGTYLTSDLSIALLYSPHGQGWIHSLLGPALSCVAVCEMIDHPDVKCQAKKKDSSEIDRKRARAKNSEGGDVPEKYFVVTNNQLLRVKYLLVYSQKQPQRGSRQPSWLSRHLFAVSMTFYLLLLVVIGLSSSKTFTHLWKRLLG
ncbi:protein mono-ADP-ribosyltransferase PARP16 isoform X2 [Bombina bombina]|uniref:protein mono-ADP-ribosyltransferase PARP16 isoform X2 n=1 Tax=Bombina bombina TaxID=8345 RepID=UPI00235AC70A|nr:protein mono-ADP-ribosyltransferase PARP16 isoform X2 [Bombina bombina]